MTSAQRFSYSISSIYKKEYPRYFIYCFSRTEFLYTEKRTDKIIEGVGAEISKIKNTENKRENL